MKKFQPTKSQKVMIILMGVLILIGAIGLTILLPSAPTAQAASAVPAVQKDAPTFTAAIQGDQLVITYKGLENPQAVYTTLYGSYPLGLEDAKLTQSSGTVMLSLAKCKGDLLSVMNVIVTFRYGEDPARPLYTQATNQVRM